MTKKTPKPNSVYPFLARLTWFILGVGLALSLSLGFPRALFPSLISLVLFGVFSVVKISLTTDMTPNQEKIAARIGIAVWLCWPLSVILAIIAIWMSISPYWENILARLNLQ
ncbi:MAG: hypothetical protein AAB443_02360 [Patescibacteria group bacterium]